MKASKQLDGAKLEEKREKNRTPTQWKSQITVEQNRSIDWDNRKTKLQAKNITLKKQLDEKVKELKVRDGQLKKMKDSAKRKEQNESQATADDPTTSQDKIMSETILKLLASNKGISWLTIFNYKWHSNNTEAAKILFGYNSWKETKLNVGAYFPDLDVNYDSSKTLQFTTGSVKVPMTTPFEHCLLAPIFFHCFTKKGVLALIFSMSSGRIGNFFQEWAPHWGIVGLDLGILDISSEYIARQAPERHIIMGKFKLVYVDGKDWHVAKIGSDNTLEKSTYSSKTEQTAARCNTYSCDGGCTFEHTRLVGGRGGENPIQAWWGSTGPKNAPVHEWEDVANTKPWKRTSLDNVMSVSDFNAALSRLIEGDPMLVHGAMNDSILVTARPTSISREGLDADTNDSSSNEDADDQSM